MSSSRKNTISISPFPSESRRHIASTWGEPRLSSPGGSTVVVYPPPVLVHFPPPTITSCPQEGFVGPIITGNPWKSSSVLGPCGSDNCRSLFG